MSKLDTALPVGAAQEIQAQKLSQADEVERLRADLWVAPMGTVTR